MYVKPTIKFKDGEFYISRGYKVVDEKIRIYDHELIIDDRGVKIASKGFTEIIMNKDASTNTWVL